MRKLELRFVWCQAKERNEKVFASQRENLLTQKRESEICQLAKCLKKFSEVFACYRKERKIVEILRKFFYSKLMIHEICSDRQTPQEPFHNHTESCSIFIFRCVCNQSKANLHFLLPPHLAFSLFPSQVICTSLSKHTRNVQSSIIIIEQ